MKINVLPCVKKSLSLTWSEGIGAQSEVPRQTDHCFLSFSVQGDVKNLNF